MTEDAWKLLAEEFAELPDATAGPATPKEIAAAEELIGLPFPADYREFLLRYGGGVVGGLSLFGVRPSILMGAGQTLAEQNRWYHRQRWPGLNPVLVISSDGSGNPIGIGPDGRIWRSDHNAAYVYDCMADSFEELLLGCLGALPPPEREPVKTVYERMADQQRELLAGLEVSSQPATLDYDNIWVEAPWDALDEPRVVLAAYAPEQPRDRPVNLWHLTPQARPQSTPDDHYLDLNTLWIKRPSLVKVLALPAGFRAYLDGETIEAIFDAAGQQVLGTGGPQSV